MQQPLVLVLALVACGVGQQDDEVVWTVGAGTPADTQQRAVQRMLLRLLSPAQAHQITVVITNVSQLTGVAWGGVIVGNSASGSGITVTAQTGYQAAFGVNRYLRQYCNYQNSWDGVQQSVMPERLPAVKQKMVLSPVRPLVMVNIHSQTWEIWYSAGNGSPTPVPYQIYPCLGMNRMGNLKKWAGPLSPDWHEQELRVQQRIVARMVELGMRPVLAAFAGIVPDGLARVYPTANITRAGCWDGLPQQYTCDHFLDPLDPLFLTVANEIMQETDKAYGLHQLYSADPWNEQRPRSFAHDYLSAVGRHIYTGMHQADEHAVWVMQAWMFIKDEDNWLADDNARVLIESVPKDRLLLLDLYSEHIPVYTELDGYYGQPYVWNMLHSFGGKDEMYGSVARVNQGVGAAMNLTNGTHSYVLAGTGLTMEGIYQNYAIYQFAIDRFWSRTEIDTEQWISQYATQRYGREDVGLQTGWKILWVGGTGIGGDEGYLPMSIQFWFLLVL